LCNHGLVAQAATLVSISNSAGQTSLSTSTYTVYTYRYVLLLFFRTVYFFCPCKNHAKYGLLVGHPFRV
jgi:hypothetical protein